MDEENIAGEVKTIFEAAEYDIITASSQTEVEELYNQMIQDMYDAGLAQLEEVLTEKYNTAQAKYDATKGIDIGRVPLKRGEQQMAACPRLSKTERGAGSNNECNEYRGCK